MPISENDIESIVRDVLSEIGMGVAAESTYSQASANGLHGAFATADEAVEAAVAAQKKWIALPLETRKECVEAMRQAGRDNALSLAQMAVEETGLGRVAHKEIKNLLCANKTPGFEMMELDTAYGDNGLTIEDYFPFGVICGITPVTNPTSGLINNAIIFAVGGNSAVFCPHPSAKNCTLKTMALMNDAVVKTGGPRNMFTAVAEPTLKSASQIMHHKAIRLINATGGPGVVKAALGVGKKAVCAGPGNPPVIVDETADLDNAARCIVEGTGFDNNVLCIGEKATFAVNSVADALIEKMRGNGAYLAQGNEAARLIEYLIVDSHPNKDAVGKNASWILQQIGVSVSDETPIVMLEVPEDHPLILEEQLMPVMPIARVRDFTAATTAAFRCEGGRGHTLVIHSQNINRITAVRNAYHCTVFVANGSAAAAEGVGGEGWVAMSLAGHTGEGFTSPLTFVKKRRSTFAGSLGTGGSL